MVNSGVKIEDDVIAVTEQLKKHSSKGGIFVFKSAGKGKGDSIVLKEAISTKKKHPLRYTVKQLDDDKAAFALLEIKYKVQEGKREKVALIMWAPENANVKVRMTAASSAPAIKTKLAGSYNVFIELTEKRDNMTAVLNKVLGREECIEMEGSEVYKNDRGDYVYKCDGHSDTDCDSGSDSDN